MSCQTEKVTQYGNTSVRIPKVMVEFGIIATQDNYYDTWQMIYIYIL